jgi:protein phosphatase
MATTLSVAVSLNDNLIVIHVGDSPVFLWRAGCLERLTASHSSMITVPALQPGEAARFRIGLTRAIGMPDAGGTPDLLRLKLQHGDRILMCTDGLTDMLEENIIAEVLGRGSSSEVCRNLVDRALARGGKDNITVIAACYTAT